MESRPLISIDELTLDQKNSRKHGRVDIAATSDSLFHFGQQSPIVLTPDRRVVKGNGTVMAARLLLERKAAAASRQSSGQATADDALLLSQDWGRLWYAVTNLEGAALQAYAIADNKTGVLAPFDLGNVGDAIRGWATEGTLEYAVGWTETDITSFIGMEKEPDDPGEKMDRAEELLQKWGVQPGDLYAIAGRQNHRLLVDDCTTVDNMARLMESRLADLLLTDPPYNVDYSGHVGSERLGIENDAHGEGYGAWLHSVLTTASLYLGKGRSFYVWYANSESDHVFQAVKNAGLKVRECLIWKKNSMVMGRQDYHWQHEPCLFGDWDDELLGPTFTATVIPIVGTWAADPKCDPAATRYIPTFQPCIYGWKAGAAHRWFADRKQTTILEFDRPSRSEAHPTMKPVELMSYQMRNSTRAGELILDPFLGSGTTMIAAELSDRQCFGLEIAPKFAAVILERMSVAGAKVQKL